MTSKFHRVLEVVAVQFHTKFYQTECSGSSVIVSRSFCRISQWWKVR